MMRRRGAAGSGGASAASTSSLTRRLYRQALGRHPMYRLYLVLVVTATLWVILRLGAVHRSRSLAVRPGEHLPTISDSVDLEWLPMLANH
jgi:hypothetical protein